MIDRKRHEVGSLALLERRRHGAALREHLRRQRRRHLARRLAKRPHATARTHPAVRRCSDALALASLSRGQLAPELDARREDVGAEEGTQQPQAERREQPARHSLHRLQVRLVGAASRRRHVTLGKRPEEARALLSEELGGLGSNRRFWPACGQRDVDVPAKLVGGKSRRRIECMRERWASWFAKK